MFTVTKEDSRFIVKDEYGSNIYSTKEMCVLYTYDKEHKEGSVSKWGNFEKVSERMKQLQLLHSQHEELFKDEELHIGIFPADKFPAELITRFLDTAFLIGTFHKGFVLGDKECQDRIKEVMKKEGIKFQM